ncbi:two-component sensor histidine kinase [Virgisporangium aliadipatigenens]|uniref:histidine kinase n=1 Tax=Virgisporangium aliadipatigenens TaxID=741659 RepID=A0A8J4DML9_9ACTN|nr:HAMP domain-containing sensor histidine kinase [Virgisporangium aliadipatigenens]GIJ43930.1 two-component sensor histidine kinase [Virgisporangium aliadipatigenens]
MADRVPLRRSLLLRLIATSILIVVCSTAATAWLAVQSTTRAFQQAQGQALTDDAAIYDALVGFAALHPTWDGVSELVADLSQRTGRQIVITTLEGRTPIAVSSPAADLPERESATLNPLNTDSLLSPNSASDRIDRRAVGPYRLTDQERADQKTMADRILTCLTRSGFDARAVEQPNGRQKVEITSPNYAGLDDAKEKEVIRQECGGPAGGARPVKPGEAADLGPDGYLDELMPTELRALDVLNRSSLACLSRQGIPAQKFYLRSPTERDISDMFPENQRVTAQNCVDSSYREQLRPYVAPPALLFVMSPGGISTTRFNLSRENLLRIAGVTALVLTITIAITALVAARLIRPLRALTEAAQDPSGGPARVGDRGEIGVLAAALNDLSERRERADAQRKDLVRDVAHELRTPLTNIRSWLEAAEDGLATPLSDPALTAALLNEALQLQHLIDDLQDLAAADAGRLRLHREPVRVADLLDQVVTAHGGNADAAAVTLATRTSGDPSLPADPVRLRQAVGNLVSNAVRYTPPGGRVTVHGRLVEDVVELEVSDTGTGIAAEDLPHVFDRFWRADRSRTRETGGSGLGLAIVKQIVDAHNGSVTVTSAPGRGTTFTMRFPTRAPAIR